MLRGAPEEVIAGAVAAGQRDPVRAADFNEPKAELGEGGGRPPHVLSSEVGVPERGPCFVLRAEKWREKLQTAFSAEQAAVLSHIIDEAFTDVVKTGDFNELKEIVRDLGVKMGELAAAQARTEERMGRLEEAMERLAEAQARTEERVGRLEEAVERLAEAQARTERRLEELAAAQTRTEQELRELAAALADTRRQVGGLSTTVGYRLEDEAFKALPGLLERDYRIVVRGRLTRRFVRDNRGEYIEVNILGTGARNGKELTIVGESKSQLSKNGVDDFIRKKLRRLEGVFPGVFPVLVTYMVTEPDVEDYVREKGIALYYSYDF